jgi:hypothetical protein
MLNVTQAERADTRLIVERVIMAGSAAGSAGLDSDDPWGSDRYVGLRIREIVLTGRKVRPERRYSIEQRSIRGSLSSYVPLVRLYIWLTSSSGSWTTSDDVADPYER